MLNQEFYFCVANECLASAGFNRCNTVNLCMNKQNILKSKKRDRFNKKESYISN